MKHCTNCGAAIGDQDKFCDSCGAAQTEAAPDMGAQPYSTSSSPQPPVTEQPNEPPPNPLNTEQPQQPYAQPSYEKPAYEQPPYTQPQTFDGQPQQPYGQPQTFGGRPQQPYGQPQYGQPAYGDGSAALAKTQNRTRNIIIIGASALVIIAVALFFILRPGSSGLSSNSRAMLAAYSGEELVAGERALGFLEATMQSDGRAIRDYLHPELLESIADYGIIDNDTLGSLMNVELASILGTNTGNTEMVSIRGISLDSNGIYDVKVNFDHNASDYVWLELEYYNGTWYVVSLF